MNQHTYLAFRLDFNAESLACCEKTLHGLGHVQNDARHKLLSVFGRVSDAVDDAHLLDNGTLAGLARAWELT